MKTYRNKNGTFMKGHGYGLKHGLCDTRFYHIWENINNRCKNKKHQSFYLYGGKGIKNKWLSFKEFKNDMYESYLLHVKKFSESNTSIDRINGNKSYSKENCRWATHKEQMRNTKRTHLIKFGGETKCITDWAKFLNVSVSTLYYRVSKLSIEEAFNK